MEVREDAQTCHHHWPPTDTGRIRPAVWAVQAPHEANHRHGGEKSGQEELFAFILRYLIRQQEWESEGEYAWPEDSKGQVEQGDASEVQARESKAFPLKFF